MKKIIILALLLLPAIASAENIGGEYPICKSENAIKEFSSAKMFNDFAKVEKLVTDGDCTFVEPDIKAVITERSLYPKVLVFIPYKSPMTGWTSMENFR
jgi:hypothetical protein